ncbi:MAG: hypothetical protein DA330_10175 [Nitrososphaera sp.]|nr:hypothetical protein [Nitrososphaera sp.]
MHVAKVEKSADSVSFSLYDENLKLLESESFADLYTLNFHLQTLAKKYGLQKSLLVIHDIQANKVTMEIAKDENSFFV